MKKWNQLLLASFSALMLTLPATAHVVEAQSEKEAENAVKNRQALFTLIRDNMGPLGAMAKGKIPYDTQIMEANSLRLQQFGDMIHHYLSVDTRKFDVQSDAKAVLWEDFSEVEKKANDLKVAAKNLSDVVATGDESQYRKAIGQLGSTCKACHDDYKKD
ncbi:c-type cytochrome [Alteromonas sp. ASW11-130]|uniref:c-type cytochrome n=1 Tax=Alteromonas sp. ASW11-130 TaxID=3015775 RepID=UPI002241B2B0|nr:cytochrome c [Alteromonas sp. ASW11-130]MCW8091438.1 cytochrome c [Alteromonas sp. ASW11-130]